MKQQQIDRLVNALIAEGCDDAEVLANMCGEDGRYIDEVKVRQVEAAIRKVRKQRAKQFKAQPTARPWRLGMRTGHNSDYMYDRSGKDVHHDASVLRFAGMDMSTKLADQPDTEGFANARLAEKALRCHEGLVEAVQTLVDMYVSGRAHTPGGGFISCITPKHASEMTEKRRAHDPTWKAWDAAQAILREARKDAPK